MIFINSKHPKKLRVNNSKTNYTAFACCNAYGSFLPLHILFKAQRLNPHWTLDGPKGATYDKIDSCWMDDVSFARWF